MLNSWISGEKKCTYQQYSVHNKSVEMKLCTNKKFSFDQTKNQMDKTLLLNKYNSKTETSGTPSINDLREMEFNNEQLTVKEKQALMNFDRFRINELNAQEDDMSFHKRYRELQVMANLHDFQEFLKEKYFS